MVNNSDMDQARREFDRLFAVHSSGRVTRLRHRDVKLICSKLLEFIARRFQTSFSRRSRLPWGDTIHIVYPDTVSLDISRFGFYEEGLTRMVLDYLKPGMTFLDIGAHIGYYTMLAAWLVGDNGQVHSFEPTPGTFTLLQSNAGNKANVILNPVAVSSESGNISFNDYGRGSMGANSRFTARVDAKSLKSIQPVNYQVPATTVDEYVESNGLTPNFVKIDAESSAHKILRGMQATLSSHRPAVSVEVGDMDIEGVPPSRELIEFLSNQGYRAYDFGSGGIVRHQLRNRYEYSNILFLPGSQ